eukprot:GHRR01009504.1.p1 GENE.GHRR01009504.1~~GHRR01009504.1.p1  ORF type:complete len:268 (+),score=68.52 GHRR01009504.1:109-912(+)
MFTPVTPADLHASSSAARDAASIEICSLVQLSTQHQMRLQRPAPFFSSCTVGNRSVDTRLANVTPAASRRGALSAGLVLVSTQLVTSGVNATEAAAAAQKPQYEPMEALKGKDYGKPRMVYPDFTMTPSGLQYKDLREGTGETPQPGDTLIIDWDGYTIGYYGRPFEARNKPKGGSFMGDDKDFLHIVLGKHEVIPAFEEAVSTMKVGGIRRIVVPVELGYPNNDYKKQGPKPTTFSGERALAFVLGNQGMIDKTLLFDIDLIRLQR